MKAFSKLKQIESKQFFISKFAKFHNRSIEQLPSYLSLAFKDYYPQIQQTPFVDRLKTGELSIEIFNNFIEQDTLYLYYWGKYWEQLSYNLDSKYIDTLLSIKTINIKEEPFVIPSKETLKSIQFLQILSTINQPTIQLFGLSSCFVLYFYLTEDIAIQASNKHPYKEWLDLYSSPDRKKRTQDLVFVLNNFLLSVNEKHHEKLINTAKTAAYLDLRFLQQF